ncbi:hypothetical protein MTO96_003321 [Rhipicephalus appendiculatus]
MLAASNAAAAANLERVPSQVWGDDVRLPPSTTIYSQTNGREESTGDPTSPLRTVARLTRFLEQSQAAMSNPDLLVVEQTRVTTSSAPASPVSSSETVVVKPTRASSETVIETNVPVDVKITTVPVAVPVYVEEPEPIVVETVIPVRNECSGAGRGQQLARTRWPVRLFEIVQRGSGSSMNRGASLIRAGGKSPRHTGKK